MTNRVAWAIVQMIIWACFAIAYIFYFVHACRSAFGKNKIKNGKGVLIGALMVLSGHVLCFLVLGTLVSKLESAIEWVNALGMFLLVDWIYQIIYVVPMVTILLVLKKRNSANGAVVASGFTVLFSALIFSLVTLLALFRK